MKNLLAPVGFIRDTFRGHRLRPWRSPYLRWRIETYSGIPAESITAASFWKFLLSEKGRLLHLLRWTAEMEKHTKPQTKGR